MKKVLSTKNLKKFKFFAIFLLTIYIFFCYNELKEKLKAQETIADTLETPPEENITPETVNPEQNLIKYQESILILH